MRPTYLSILLVSALSHVATAGDPPAWVKLWQGSFEKIADHWVAPGLDARLDGTELEVSAAISVGSMTELGTQDVAIELHAGKRKLACEAESMGWIQTKGITAQAAASCHNPDKRLPTEIVATVKGTAHTFPIKITSLKKLSRP